MSKNEEYVDQETTLWRFFQNDVENVSKQRLRAIHMSLRRYGNVESRITQSNLQHAFEENNVNLNQRQFQMVTEAFEDHLGIDYEKVYKVLVRAQASSENEFQKEEKRIVLSRDERDQDILCRIEEQLVRRLVYFDLDAIKEAFQSSDSNRTGKVSIERARVVLAKVHMPLYGALLTNLLNRCVTENNDLVSWPEFINFLERAQKRAWEKFPHMADLPNQVKEEELANPDVIDELSSSAKTKVISKLLKKASIQREKSTFGKHRESKDRRNPNAPTYWKKENESLKGNTINDKNANNITITKVNPTVVQEERNDNAEEYLDKIKEEQGCAKTENYVKSSDHSKIILQIKGKMVKVMKPPGLHYQDAPIDPPRERLRLEWIYGYRGNDCRNNIYKIASGEIIYFMANIVILYNRTSHHQRHYLEHTEHVKSIAVNSDGSLIASGQQSSKLKANILASINIWRADDLQTLHVVGEGVLQKAVVCLTFQHDSDLLSSIDNGENKKFMVWDTTNGNKIAETTINTEVVCDMSCNPRMPELFVTAGKEHLNWWKVNTDTNTIAIYSQANYETYLRARFVICVSHNSRGDLITGDSNGTIYVWGNSGNKITNFVKHGHEGPVFSLHLMKHHLLTGGRDGIIYAWEWNKNMDCVGKLEVAKTEGGIRMIQICDQTILIGTTMNSMLASTLSSKGSPLDSAVIDPLPITQGHFDDLSGLCEIQRSFMGANFLTAGTDGIICKFNALTHEPSWKLVMKGSSFLCADCSTNGKLLCLGTMDGYLIIMEINADTYTVSEHLHRKISKDRLECVIFSPDHNSVAVGGNERSITIYSCVDKDDGTQVWQCIGKCWGHKGCVTAIDWSAEKKDDIYFLRSSSSFPDQLYWNATTCEKVDFRETNDVAWNTQNCVLDYNLTGVWCSKQINEANIHNVSVNTSKTLVAVCDTQGYMSLFRYPCNKEQVFSHTYKSLLNTQKLIFSSKGKYVIVAGGQDACITQWVLVGTE